MFGKVLRVAALGLVVFPPAALGLGLGDIHLDSSLNAPLRAEIELLGATPEELSGMTVALASRETFARYGLDRPAFLNSVTLKPARTGGRDVIEVRSGEAITEPFVTLLVEVNWARGRLVREYTVLLDPPVYAPVQGAPSSIEAPAAGAGQRSGDIERAPQPQPASQPAPAGTPAAAGGRSYTVQRGEALSTIAARLGGNGSAARLMVGIYRANPTAFDGDMNSLRAGAILRVPAADELANIQSGEAASEVRRQYQAWRQRSGGAAASGSAGEGRLRLVTPGDKPGSGAATATADAGELQGLRDRVRGLEGELSESRRLIELRNTELADLQAKLAAAQGTRPSPLPAGEAAGGSAPPPAAAPAPEGAAPATAVAAKPAVQPPARRARATGPAGGEGGGGLLEALKALWYVPVLLIALLGGLFGYRKFRERRQVEFDDQLGRLAADQAGAQAESARDLRDTTRLRHPVTRDEESFLVEESGTHERPVFEGLSGGEAMAARSVSADETLSSETAINLDQGDPLAEADFHMAYGLYDQAADLVRIASTREPQRRDLKLKLLEVFFVWGNREQFLQTARELAETRAEALPGEWEKVVIMGRQLAPDDPLFAHEGVSGAAAAGIDLNLEGGQNRVDFDLFNEPGAEPLAAPSAVDLDRGDRDPTGEARTVAVPGTAAELDFLLDDSMGGAEASGHTTRQMTSKLHPEPTVSLAGFASEGSEAPTVEQPALRGGEDATLRQKLEGARPSPVADQTAELSLDDLGLDLGTLESPAADAPTLIAGVDERSREIMAAAGQAPAPGAEQPSASGTWFIDQSGLDVGIQLPKAADGSETSRLATLEAADGLDLDLSSLEATHPSGPNGAGAALDLDVGAATAHADGPYEATQRVDADELALPDLEPVTMSEVGTKLDLARAYMDMGDPEGARSILEEVLQEGSQSQKQEAQRLVDSLPG